MTENIITINNISKSYKDILALNKLNLEVKKGEMFGLIGPDGAGKTTLTRILATLLLPDSGICYIDNFNVVKEFRKVRKIIGYMPERFSLYPDLTVKENLRFFADLFNVKTKVKEKRLKELLKFNRLEPFQNRKTQELSGGMKQKLALSCTLIHTPRLLILDEPTTGVDPLSRREFWAILNTLKNMGVSIFITTPYLSEAENCDRIGLLHNGQILTIDTPDKIPLLFSHELIEIKGENLFEVSRKLKNIDSIIDIQIFGDKLHLTVEKAEKVIPLINGIFKKLNIKISEVNQVNPGIEDTFIELIKS
ncbi:ABC transporter ATP-binding protein [candidate division KSB1 bacterium]|nr:MAG: ABC transporter ATP-binding protein [candidate division KSB1 bacterium]